MSAIKLVSFNCRGIGNIKKRKDVFDYLRRKDFNICFLQDIHCKKSGVVYFRNVWGRDILIAPGTSNSRGVAILTKEIDVSYSEISLDDNGNYIIAKAIISDMLTVCLVNIYGPNLDDPNFYRKICLEIDNKVKEEEIPIIIGGDFNLTLNQELDNFNYRNENNIGAKGAVKKMMANKELVDIFRIRNPELRRYTWRVGRPAVKQARLDMFLISKCFEGYVESTDVCPGYRSDHSMVKLNIDISKQVKGRGLFKFNASLLNDQNYAQLVKNVIKDVALEYAVPVYNEHYVRDHFTSIEPMISSRFFFEVLMLTIRRETISFGIRQKKEDQKEVKQLECSISELESKLSVTGSEDIRDQLDATKKQLEQLREEKLKGSIVRSRAVWRENAEKPSKYFLTLEKRRYASKRISCIRTTEGIVNDQRDILKAFKDFFQKRFRESVPDGLENEEGKYFSDIALTKLKATKKQRLESHITLFELGSTLFKMKNGTSPGSDGFTVEFYKFFWAYLKDFFFAMCVESFSCESLPQTLREGIIVLLPKPNKPRDLIKSYRPITLLNVGYKIISGTIANRMKEALEDMIDPCQAAYLKGRYIGNNIRMIYDVIHLMNHETNRCILLSLDIEAAFDSVSWLFIKKVMKERNFPHYIIKWFETLHAESFSRALYNGHLSSMIKLGRSCRQGDALSCYLFILVMDVLANRINCNPAISGVKIGTMGVKVEMHADDTVCIIEPRKEYVTELFF